MENNNEQEERYLLKGGVEYNDKTDKKEKRNNNYEDIGLTSILNELEKIPSLNIDNELLTPIKQEYAIQEYKIANNDNEIKKLQTENEILKKQQNENRKLINSIKKKESNITKINVPRNTKYISFQTVQNEEPIIQKQRMLVNQEYENAIKMKEIADSLYGSDEEYFKKFYENNKKPVWYIPEKTKTKPKVNAISDSEKMFFPNGTLADMPPTKLPDTNKQKDYNEIEEIFYPDMEVKKKNKNGILTGGAADIAGSNNNKKVVDTNKVLEILGLNSNEYQLKGNTISPKSDYSVINGVKYFKNNEKAQHIKNDIINKKKEENTKEREKYLNTIVSKPYQYAVDNVDKTIVKVGERIFLGKESSENLHMSKADSYMNTDYAKTHKVYSNYKKAPKELQEYLKDKITEQIGADKLETTKGIYIDKNSNSSKKLSKYLSENKDFIKKLKKYEKTMKYKFLVDDSIYLKDKNLIDRNWHNALGNTDIKKMHINKNGDVELYVTDIYDFNELEKSGAPAVGRDRQEKGVLKPYFVIYHVIIQRKNIIN